MSLDDADAFVVPEALSALDTMQREATGALHDHEMWHDDGELTSDAGDAFLVEAEAYDEWLTEQLAFECMWRLEHPQYADLARRFYEEGRDDGELHGRAVGELRGAACALFVVIESRGLPLAQASRERIEAAQDPTQLNRWLLRAVSATTLAEIFDA